MSISLVLEAVNNRRAEVKGEMCYDRWLSTSFPNTLSVRNRGQGA